MNLNERTLTGKPVVFLDGLEIRHGVALSQRGGVWSVRCGRELVEVWEDDIFTDICQVQKALNMILN